MINLLAWPLSIACMLHILTSLDYAPSSQYTPASDALLIQVHSHLLFLTIFIRKC